MNILLAIWIALIGADRINLAGQNSPFILTPFLVLSPVVILGELVRRHRAKSPITVPRGALAFLVLALALLSMSMGSVYLSRDFSTSAIRVVQLALMIFGTLSVILVARDRSDLDEILARGARYGIFVYLAFNVAAILVFFKILPETVPPGLGILRFAPYLYAGFVPRLAGMVEDANRGGLLLVFFSFLLANGDKNRNRMWRWLMLATVMLVLTLSRSAMLAAAGAIGVMLLSGSGIRIPRNVISAISLLVALGATTLLLVPRSRNVVATSLEPILGRLTVVEGSSQDHLHLLIRGVYTGTRSVGAALHGLGYGSSHVVLQDFFPGSRYGNFHSVYVGIFAEVGVFALIVLLLLIGVPLSMRGPYRPLVAAVACFGVFYGALSEPLFWLVLVLAWSGFPVRISRPKAIVNATAMPRIAPSSS